MKNTWAVFMKQVNETFKNKTILIQFLMFPLLVIVMENAVLIDNMPEHFFVKLFSVMFVGMAPLTCMSSIISEEREKNTLKVLMMSNVRPVEYLLGVGSYVFLMCTAGTLVFAVVGEYRGKELAVFTAVMSAGIVLSELTGAMIGIFSRSQMTAASVTVPVMMVFSFLPMLSMFNESIKKAAAIMYSQQLSEMINGIGTTDIHAKSIVILLVNYAAAAVAFAAAYKRKGLE